MPKSKPEANKTTITVVGQTKTTMAEIKSKAPPPAPKPEPAPKPKPPQPPVGTPISTATVLSGPDTEYHPSFIVEAVEEANSQVQNEMNNDASVISEVNKEKLPPKKAIAAKKPVAQQAQQKLSEKQEAK